MRGSGWRMRGFCCGRRRGKLRLKVKGMRFSTRMAGIYGLRMGFVRARSAIVTWRMPGIRR